MQNSGDCMENKDYIEKLSEFKSLLQTLSYAVDDERYNSLRTEINRKKAFVMNVMRHAKTLKLYTVGPPSAVGGLVLNNLNPFDVIFDPPYGRSIVPTLMDAIDETIGVIESNPDFNLELINKSNMNKKSLSKRIFIVHGHDETMKLDVSNVLRQLDFEPIILNDKASGGKTIIEKIESYSDVGFAIVLMSPCDVGYKKGDEANAKPRARQNVIAELGYFVGLLGRNKTFILKKDEVEEPSDFSGIVYEPYDSKGAWKMQLVKELKAAGFSVDANKIM